MATPGLQVNPHDSSILSLHVLMLLLTIAAVPALATPRNGLVAVGSLAVCAAGQLWRALSTPYQSGPARPAGHDSTGACCEDHIASPRDLAASTS